MSSEQDRWRGHPVLAAGLRVAILAVPLLLGYVASVVGARLLARRIDQSHWWLVVVVAVSVAICLGVERVTRRLLPLAALLKLSMLFPDRAPSRFKIARGAASTRLLNERVTQARSRDAAAVANAVLELITALGAHDRRTRGHCERVRVFGELLGQELRLPRESQDKLRWASLLHDIGKLEVAPEILNKPSKLNPTEWDLVAEHPLHGEELLGPLIEWLGEWGSAVRQHHERYDGDGYPDRLAGAEISRAARIVAIVDSYEVMTAHRAYKKPMATVTARAELARCAGTQFDPMYVRAFLSISLPRLLWAMGPGSLLMNLPLLRILAETTNKGLLAIPQGAVAAASTAIVIGGVVASGTPVAAAGAPPSITAGSSVHATGTHHHASSPSATKGNHPGGRGGAASTGGGGGGGGNGGGTASSTSSADPTASATGTEANALPTGAALGGLTTDGTTPGATDDGSTATIPTDGSGDASTGSAPATGAATDSGSSAPVADPTTSTASAAPTTPATTSAAPVTSSSAPAPSAPVLVSKPPSSGLLPTITFTWVQQSGLTYEYKLDNGSWVSLGSTNTFTTIVLIGTHEFRLRALNASGQGGPSPETDYSFTVII